jgi:hypothetical protein
MKKHTSFPKITQFRNICQDIRQSFSYVGKDEQGNIIYNTENLVLPTIKFKGTVKNHGTNSAICYNLTDGIYTQSRNQYFSIDKSPEGHFGFNFFVVKNKEIIKSIFDEIIENENCKSDDYKISIFGEWAGKEIQKGVAVSQLEKAFYIFAVFIENTVNPGLSYWADYTKYRNPENRIFNIDDFGTYEIEIDFNNPSLVTNKILDLTLEIERECPIGKYFGISGIGEGVVFTGMVNNKRYVFKSKGELHSASKVKTLSGICSSDVETMKNVAEFIEYAVTDNRLKQAIQTIFGESVVSITKTGDVIKWVVTDILLEETDVMVQNNLEPKMVGNSISKKVREMFMKYLSENL